MIKRWIYILNKDTRLVERVSSSIKRQISEYNCLELADLPSLKAAIGSRRPEIVILSLESVGGSNCLNLIRFIRGLTTAIPINIIVTATRKNLDEHQASLENYNVEVAPLPLRIPLLMEKVQRFVDETEAQKNRDVYLSSGQLLFSEGDLADSVFIVQSGTRDIMKKKDNVMVNFKTISVGEVVGEMAFLDQRPRSATVVASSDCHLIKLDIGDIEGYLNNQPEWVRLYMKTLTQRLREADEELVDKKITS